MVGKRRPEDKPWGMYEFAITDPDQTLVHIGWPTHLANRHRLLRKMSRPFCGGILIVGSCKPGLRVSFD